MYFEHYYFLQYVSLACEYTLLSLLLLCSIEQDNASSSRAMTSGCIHRRAQFNNYNKNLVINHHNSFLEIGRGFLDSAYKSLGIGGGGGNSLMWPIGRCATDISQIPPSPHTHSDTPGLTVPKHPFSNKVR